MPYLNVCVISAKARSGDHAATVRLKIAQFNPLQQQVVTLRVCASRWTEVCGFTGSWRKKQTKIPGVLKIIIIFVIISLCEVQKGQSFLRNSRKGSYGQ